MKRSTTIPVDEMGTHGPDDNGIAERAPGLPLAPPRSMRSRVPQAMLAGLLILGGGLGGLLLFNQYNQRTSAVVVTAPVSHGTPLAREDLALAEVAVDGSVVTLDSLDDAVGRFAAHDLVPGELVTPSDLANEDQIVTDREAVVGLLLEPGEYPTTRLAAGDRVDVFAPGLSGGPLATDLVVFDVVESSSDGRTLLVSVIVPNDRAGAVFDAAADGGVRLSLRGQE